MLGCVQGMLQSITSSVGSAATTVTSSAKNAVNRLTGDGTNGTSPGYAGPTVCTLALVPFVLSYLCMHWYSNVRNTNQNFLRSYDSTE